MPTFRNKSYAAFLFDMDGTMVDSSIVVERVWSEWALRHGLDAKEVLAAVHGVRAEELVRRFGPRDVEVSSEVARLLQAEIEDISGVRAVRGVTEIVKSLGPACWAVVTSAPRALATVRLAAAQIPLPHVLIAAEDVDRGKPDPEGFLKAAEALRVNIHDCLVFEDAPAGIEAAKAAGASVAIVGARSAHLVGDYTIEDYLVT